MFLLPRMRRRLFWFGPVKMAIRQSFCGRAKLGSYLHERTPAMPRIILFLLMAFLVSLSPSCAEEDEHPLKGIGAIQILVNTPDAALSKLGFNAQNISDRVELRLRKSRIPIALKSDHCLYIAPSGMVDQNGTLIWHLSYEIDEFFIHPMRKRKVYAPLWHISTMGLRGQARTKEFAENLDEMADKFILEYLRDN